MFSIRNIEYIKTLTSTYFLFRLHKYTARMMMMNITSRPPALLIVMYNVMSKSEKIDVYKSYCIIQYYINLLGSKIFHSTSNKFFHFTFFVFYPFANYFWVSQFFVPLILIWSNIVNEDQDISS